MTSNRAGKAALVALNEGLPPHAEALDCEDLRGPRSMFGESAPIPRPIGYWSDSGPLPPPRGYEHCLVLWEDREPTPCLPAAARISATPAESVRRGGNGAAAQCRLDLPASVYIGGTCSSTFSVAWKLHEDGLMPEWGAVICTRQTQGRGQMRRPWHSPRGNLYVTFRLPDDPLLKGDCASLLAGWLLVSAFRALGFPLSLKWPNDLLLEERAKVGGILLEERDGVLMAGLGVNLAEAPGAALMRVQASLPAAVLLPHHSLSGLGSANSPRDDEAEEPLAPFPLWRRLVSEIILAYGHSAAGRDLGHILGLVDASLAWKGRSVVVRDGGDGTSRGRFMGLGPCGGLLLRSGAGERQELFSGSLFLH